MTWIYILDASFAVIRYADEHTREALRHVKALRNEPIWLHAGYRLQKPMQALQGLHNYVAKHGVMSKCQHAQHVRTAETKKETPKAIALQEAVHHGQVLQLCFA